MSLKIKNNYQIKLTVYIFVFFLLLNSIYYTFIGLNIQFLRAESGLFLRAPVFSLEQSAEFFNKYIYSSHNGHYTPLVFLAEYWQSKIFNTQEHFWFWRQMIVVALFLTSIALFSIKIKMLGNDDQKPTLKITSIGLLIAIIFGFQPIVTTLVAWPFMAFQLICLTVSSISFYNLVQFAHTANRVQLWLALGLGYLTMHIFGLGLAISLSVLITSTLLISLRWYSAGSLTISQLIKSLFPVFFVAAFTLGHTYLMLQGVTEDSNPEKVSLITSGIRFGGILIEMLQASLNYIWAPGGLVMPMMRGLEADSVYGWGLVLIILTIVASQIFKFLKEPSDELLTRISFLTLPSLALILIASMIVYRSQSAVDKNSSALIGYIIGDRYLIFSSFLGLLFFIALFLKSKIIFSKTAMVTLAVTAMVCIAGNTAFMMTTAREIWPTSFISHSEYWDDFLDDVQSEPGYDSPHWNKPINQVTIEYDSTRMMFRSLIEKQLKAREKSQE